MTAILKVLLSTILSVVTKSASKEVFEWALFYIAEKLVESTENPHDNAFLAKIKEANDEAGKE